MLQLLFGFCVGLLPALIVSLLVVRKASGESAAMRERLAAEEASKRHFMELSNGFEITIEKMHREQKRLEVELAGRKCIPEPIVA